MRKKEGMSGEISLALYGSHKYMYGLHVCVCVCVTSALCVHTAVEETSFVGLGNSARVHIPF